MPFVGSPSAHCNYKEKIDSPSHLSSLYIHRWLPCEEGKGKMGKGKQWSDNWSLPVPNLCRSSSSTQDGTQQQVDIFVLNSG